MTTPSDDEIDRILEAWLDDAMDTSIWAVSPTGYKGTIYAEEKDLDNARKKDYDKALSKAKAAISAAIPEEGNVILKAGIQNNDELQHEIYFVEGYNAALSVVKKNLGLSDLDTAKRIINEMGDAMKSLGDK